MSPLTLMSPLVSLFLTSSGSRDVAKSISSIFSPQSDFLTHPPTNLTSLSFPISLRYEKIILASFIFSKILILFPDPNFLKRKRSVFVIIFLILESTVF